MAKFMLLKNTREMRSSAVPIAPIKWGRVFSAPSVHTNDFFALLQHPRRQTHTSCTHIRQLRQGQVTLPVWRVAQAVLAPSIHTESRKWLPYAVKGSTSRMAGSRSRLKFTMVMRVLMSSVVLKGRR